MNLLLFITIFISPFIISQASSSCKRLCGKKHVPYPFGFSDACEIRLNCSDNGRILIGDFQVQNVTSDSLIVHLPASCHRPIGNLTNLFDRNYALTGQNGLLLGNCSSKIHRCKIPMTLVETNFEFRGCNNPNNNYMSCFSIQEVKDKNFMSFEILKQSSCEILFSSISLDASSSSGSESVVSLQFQSLQLGWWLEGSCASSKCSKNANCTDISSPFNNLPGFRCQCTEGYEGDGFNAGTSCRKDTLSADTLHADTLHADTSIHNKILIIGCICSGFGGLALMILSWIIYYNIERKKMGSIGENVELFLKRYKYRSLQRYKYRDIKKMTNSFKDKLGQGGYGSVYKGKLVDGRPVAVKVLINDPKKSTNGEDFMNEVATIGRTNHVNIVALLGFCSSGSKRALVYEFMTNGSLEKFIFAEKENNTITSTSSNEVHPLGLGWENLYQIAVGIARGLEYLHRGCNIGRILHLDIKPHNILLDENFCPKISDFGLAKLCPTRESTMLSGGRGTIGYIAPEVYNRNAGGVSYKSDVYSYGMMVLEMVGGRKNIDPFVEHTSEIYFPHWIYNHLENDWKKIEGFLKFETVFDQEMAMKMIMVGLWCIQTYQESRPSMGRVAEMLEGCITDLQMPPKPFVDPSLHPPPTS